MNNLRARRYNIAKIMYIYWVIIIIWQYVRPVENRSVIDSLVKIGVFGIICLYALNYGQAAIRKDFAGCLTVYLVCQLVTIVFDTGTFSLGSFITVAFMMAQIVIFLVFLDEEEIFLSELEWFCRSIVAIVFIMAAYNALFNASRFMTVFSAGSAYGNECKSFLYSNHEFGIYLAVGILSALWLMLIRRMNKITFIVLVAFFTVNLLSTYSRTAILGCITAIFVLLFYYRKKVFLWAAMVAGLVYVYILNNPKVYDIVFNKIMKGSFEEGQVMDEERSSMYVDQFQYFVNATFRQKMFGYGYAGAGQFPGHDAYLMVLLTGGICMLIAFIAIVLLAMNYSFKCIRVNRSVGSLMLAFQVFSLLYMIAQTPILFYSSMDCFFLTMITILIPKYIYNHLYRFNRSIG